MLNKFVLFVCLASLCACGKMMRSIGAATGMTPSLELYQIKFSDSARRAAYTFAYPDTTNNTFLRQLRTE